MREGTGVIIFTDLDGTLLDHDDYGFDPARPVLKRLQAAGIPLILASSKTAAEIADLRQRLGVQHCPAIVENGAGILPAGRDRPIGDARHARILDVLNSMPVGLRALFRGFSDWSVDEVAERTGLPKGAAAQARARDFSEPGVFLGSAAEQVEFVELLATRGITATMGGRFLTLSFGASKADRMAEVRARYPDAALAIALGDAPNDIEMIEAAEIGIVIPNPSHAGVPRLAGEATGRIRRARAPGPGGWADALTEALAEIGQPAV